MLINADLQSNMVTSSLKTGSFEMPFGTLRIAMNKKIKINNYETFA